MLCIQITLAAGIILALKRPEHCTVCTAYIVMQFDELHNGIKEDVRGKVEVYRKRLDKEKWEDYQKELTEYLDEAMKTLMLAYEQQMRTFATDKTKCFQGTCGKVCMLLYASLHVKCTSVNLQMQ